MKRLFPIFVLLAACVPVTTYTDPRAGNFHPPVVQTKIECKKNEGQCGNVCVDFLSSTENCGACRMHCNKDEICSHANCTKKTSDTNSLSTPPKNESSSVGEVLRNKCKTDLDCPKSGSCSVPFCELPRGLCSAKSVNCNDRNPQTIDVCIEDVGCENILEPEKLVLVSSCSGLEKDIVCGKNGTNYYNPCSANQSAETFYSVGPCRPLGSFCSTKTGACARGLSCVSNRCK